MLDARAFLLEVAATFERPPQIDTFEDGVPGLIWSNGSLDAGVWADGERAEVFLAEACAGIATPSDAAALLVRIFSDEVVTIAGFDGSFQRYCVLASAEDMSGPIANLDDPDPGEMPFIDRLWVRSWTGAGDQGEPPEEVLDEPGDERTDIWGRPVKKSRFGF